MVAKDRDRHIAVDIAVCGKFHFHNYVKYIDQQGLLNRFHYSHKLTTNSLSLSVRQDRLVNVWMKEYLVHLHLRLFNNRGVEYFFPLYADLWQTLVNLRFGRCDIFHVMLHGTAVKLIEKAKDGNSVVVGEPVNSHPEALNAILTEEYEMLGIKKKLNIQKLQRRLIQEANMCDHLLVASEFIGNSFIQKGFASERIHVIPYGVDPHYFSPLSKEEKTQCDSKFRAICVAQVSPRKGQVYLLEAWKKLNLPNSELLLIGAISYEMKSLLADYDGLFQHIPNIPNRELHCYYGRSSVFVLPTVEDGFGCVVTEAMACGLPVITTANAGASEIIEHGKEGFIVPIRAPDEIAKYLELLYRNKELRQQMSQAALKKSQTCLGWEQYAYKLSNLYHSMLAEDLQN